MTKFTQSSFMGPTQDVSEENWERTFGKKKEGEPPAPAPAPAPDPVPWVVIPLQAHAAFLVGFFSGLSGHLQQLRICSEPFPTVEGRVCTAVFFERRGDSYQEAHDKVIRAVREDNRYTWARQAINHIETEDIRVRLSGRRLDTDEINQ